MARLPVGNHSIHLEMETGSGPPSRSRVPCLSLVLQGGGPEEIRIAQPEDWAAAGVRMTLAGLRRDLSRDGDGNPRFRSHALGLADVVYSTLGKSVKGPWFLRPGERILLLIRFAPPWEPGSYDVTLTYAAAATDRWDKPLGDFAWTSPKVLLELGDPGPRAESGPSAQ